MATVDVLNWKKQKVGTLELAPEIFEIEVKKSVLHEVVRWQLASRRQGTAMVKGRSLVSGGGKKPFKQKGTGNARQGSTRSPLMPGGAKLFGPVPRDYSYALPKKVKKLGIKMALSQLVKEGKLLIVESMKSEGKTKEMSARLKGLGLAKASLVDAQLDEKFLRATQNLPKFKYSGIEGMNVFDLLKYDTLVLTPECVMKISERVKVD
jgi:large subunit ribosomal protein L4